MICLDSSFIIDLFKGDKIANSKLDNYDNSELCTTVVNIIEVAVGIYIKKDIDYDKHMKTLNNFFKDIPVFNLDYESGILSAKISADLIKSGKQIDANDCSVAAIMIQNECDTILTKDIKHFKRIRGIKVVTY